MEYKDTSFPLKARVNNNFSLHIDTGFPITGHIPKFSIKKSDGSIIDLSAYCIIVSETAFLISIKADIIKTLIGVRRSNYDMIIDEGEGSSEFLFSGIITVSDGVST